MEEPFFSHNFAPLPLFLSLAPPSGGWGQERERGEEQGLGFRVEGLGWHKSSHAYQWAVQSLGVRLLNPKNLSVETKKFKKPCG